ncbi:MAG: hypothetical protein RMK33_00090 [Arcobacter sp.]|nr:hypothetical protein [Bryobacteraceae bacterium]MDW8434546.1 hypothetical protein [Arcobacter sp.]
MSNAATMTTAADQAVMDRIQKCFDAIDRIAASLEQIAVRRREAERLFLDSLLGGSFEGGAVLNALNGWKQQRAQFDDQCGALNEAEQLIREFLKRHTEEQSPALKQVLVREQNRLTELIGKSTDQAAALQRRLEEIRAWLGRLEGGAAQQPPPRKGGAALSA